MSLTLNAVALDEAGTAAFVLGLQAAYPELRNVPADQLVSAINEVSEASLTHCSREPFRMNAQYRDTAEPYGSETVVVPKGLSMYSFGVQDALNTRWYDGNQLENLKMVDDRTHQLFPFHLLDFKAVFEAVRNHETNTGFEALSSEYALANAIVALTDVALEPVQDFPGENGESKLYDFLDLADESSESEKDIDLGEDSFMNTSFDVGTLIEYLVERGHSIQNVSKEPTFNDVSGSYFQLAHAMQVFGKAFQDHWAVWTENQA